jgi:hypothetical protein
VQKIVQPIGAIASAALTSFVTLYARANRGGAMLLDLLGPPGLAGGAVADFVLVIFRFGATMELGRSERTTMRSNSPYSLLAIHHYRCPFPHARGWRRDADRPARPARAAWARRRRRRRFRFSDIPVRGDDGARAIGANDDAKQFTILAASNSPLSLPFPARARLGGAMPTDLLDLLGPPGWCSGCWPHDGEVAGGAIASSV